MIILDLKLNNVYGFCDFAVNFAYPKKIVNSMIENEHLAGKPNFRYKKAVILMGANATGKTSMGKALFHIFSFLSSANSAILFEMVNPGQTGDFSIDFVNDGDLLHRLSGSVDPDSGSVKLKYASAPIKEKDSYEQCASKLCEQTTDLVPDVKSFRKLFGKISCRFAYPEIETTFKIGDLEKDVLLRTLKAVVGTLDPTLKDVTVSKDLKDSFIIRRRGTEIIIQDGKLLNREVLSSGTAEGIDVAVFLASMLSKCTERSFYYCDEHFSYIHSDIEKRIFGIMLEHLKENEQLVFTTHNTDMLDLNLPKHSFAFLRKKESGGEFKTSVTYASDILKRNTDSVRCAAENDVFASLPDDSLLDSLEEG